AGFRTERTGRGGSERVAAGDLEDLTGDPARLAGGEEDDAVGDVLGVADPAERDDGAHLLDRLLGEPPGLHRPGGDRVHPDAGGRQVQGGAAGDALPRGRGGGGT